MPEDLRPSTITNQHTLYQISEIARIWGDSPTNVIKLLVDREFAAKRTLGFVRDRNQPSRAPLTS
jgi:hypothetical protein